MECLSACGEEVDGGVLERLRVEGVRVLGRGAAPGEGEVPSEQYDHVVRRRGLLLEPEQHDPEGREAHHREEEGRWPAEEPARACSVA